MRIKKKNDLTLQLSMLCHVCFVLFLTEMAQKQHFCVFSSLLLSKSGTAEMPPRQNTKKKKNQPPSLDTLFNAQVLCEIYIFGSPKYFLYQQSSSALDYDPFLMQRAAREHCD